MVIDQKASFGWTPDDSLPSSCTRFDAQAVVPRDFSTGSYSKLTTAERSPPEPTRIVGINPQLECLRYNYNCCALSDWGTNSVKEEHSSLNLLPTI